MIRMDGYLEKALDPIKLADAVRAAQETLANVQFDSIAVSGNSGTLFAGALAVAMNKNIVLVRKDVETCHSASCVEAGMLPSQYVIVDDLTSSGETLRYIRKEIDEAAADEVPPYKPICLGVYLYNSNRFRAMEENGRLA